VEKIVSQKNCSLAFEETETEIETGCFEPNLKIFVTEAFVRNSTLENSIIVEGGITVSF